MTSPRSQGCDCPLDRAGSFGRDDARHQSRSRAISHDARPLGQVVVDGRFQPGSADRGCVLTSVGLVGADLEQRDARLRQAPAGSWRQQPANEVEPVRPTIERHDRLEARGDRQRRHVVRGDVWQVGQQQVDLRCELAAPSVRSARRKLRSCRRRRGAPRSRSRARAHQLTCRSPGSARPAVAPAAALDSERNAIAPLPVPTSHDAAAVRARPPRRARSSALADARRAPARRASPSPAVGSAPARRRCKARP